MQALLDDQDKGKAAAVSPAADEDPSGSSGPAVVEGAPLADITTAQPKGDERSQPKPKKIRSANARKAALAAARSEVGIRLTDMLLVFRFSFWFARRFPIYTNPK